MERKYESQEQALNVAKEAMWLAYQASGAVGLGVLHERGGEERAKVIEHTARAQSDYAKEHKLPEEVSADYCFGRMMKIILRCKDGTLSCSDGEPRGDYQSWAGKYPTYAALIDTAEKSLSITR